MKKSVSFLVILCLLLVGCAKTDDDSRQYEKFLSNKEGLYAIYIVADASEGIEGDDGTLDQALQNVKTITHDTDLEYSQLKEIKEAPTYMVFDTKDKVYETNNKDDLLDFLTDD